MNEYIIVQHQTDGSLMYSIYELEGNGAYAPARIEMEYGIRNDPCSLEAACGRLSQLLDAVIACHLIPETVQ